MAQYQHLPLYRTAYSLLLDLMHTTKDYPREFKYSLGEKIQKDIVDLLVCIYKANSAKEKTEYIMQILEYTQFIGLYLRISHDIKILSESKYIHFAEALTSVTKQAQGWLHSCTKGTEPVCVTAQ